MSEFMQGLYVGCPSVHSSMVRLRSSIWELFWEHFQV